MYFGEKFKDILYNICCDPTGDPTGDPIHEYVTRTLIVCSRFSHFWFIGIQVEKSVSVIRLTVNPV